MGPFTKNSGLGQNTAIVSVSDKYVVDTVSLEAAMGSETSPKDSNMLEDHLSQMEAKGI